MGIILSTTSKTFKEMKAREYYNGSTLDHGRSYYQKNQMEEDM